MLLFVGFLYMDFANTLAPLMCQGTHDPLGKEICKERWGEQRDTASSPVFGREFLSFFSARANGKWWMNGSFRCLTWRVVFRELKTLALRLACAHVPYQIKESGVQFVRWITKAQWVVKVFWAHLSKLLFQNIYCLVCHIKEASAAEIPSMRTWLLAAINGQTSRREVPETFHCLLSHICTLPSLWNRMLWDVICLYSPWIHIYRWSLSAFVGKLWLASTFQHVHTPYSYRHPSKRKIFPYNDSCAFLTSYFYVRLL